MTHICFRNGVRMPAAEIIRMTHDHGALALLDDYQDCGTRPIDVKAMDLDFYVSGTLKYLLGPPGLAFMYVRKYLAESLTPTITGWFGQANPFALNEQLLEPTPNARRFESGTPPIPSIYAARAGVELLQEIGLGKVACHIKMLTASLLEGTRSLRIQVKTPLGECWPACGAESQKCRCAGAEIRGTRCGPIQSSRWPANFVSRLQHARRR